MRISEPAREVEVVHRTDVLVVGSAPGGVAAAIAAARAGAEVALLERFGCFGGNLTAVGVEGLAWYRHEATVEAGGLAYEFEERAREMGATVPDVQSRSHTIDSEGFKLVADRLVEEAGVRPMLHRLCVAPVMEGDAIAGVIVESKAGREAILARRVIDATGDADIADRAGAPTIKTPPEHMQAASVVFHLTGSTSGRSWPACVRTIRLTATGRAASGRSRRPARRTSCSPPSCASRSRRPPATASSRPT